MTTTLILTIAFFLAVILMLVSLLLFVKAKLSPAGKLTLTINGEQTMEVDGGSTLLTTLGNSGCSSHLHAAAAARACSAGARCTRVEAPSFRQKHRTFLGKKLPTTGVSDAKSR